MYRTRRPTCLPCLHTNPVSSRKCSTGALRGAWPSTAGFLYLRSVRRGKTAGFNGRSELGIAGIAGVRDNIPDVAHSRNKLHEAFEAEPKASVRSRTKAAKVKIPPQIFFREAQFVN